MISSIFQMRKPKLRARACRTVIAASSCTPTRAIPFDHHQPASYVFLSPEFYKCGTEAQGESMSCLRLINCWWNWGLAQDAFQSPHAVTQDLAISLCPFCLVALKRAHLQFSMARSCAAGRGQRPEAMVGAPELRPGIPGATPACMSPGQ